MAEISDVLRGPYGDIQPDVIITMRAKQTSARVLTSNSSSTTTDSAGKYSMTVFPGEYEVIVSTLGHVGNIKVLSDSVNGTLNDFLIEPKEDELTPEVVKTVNTYRAEAAASAVAAKTSENNAKDSADRAATTLSDALSKSTTVTQAVASAVEFKKNITSTGDQLMIASSATPSVLLRFRDYAGAEKSAIYAQTDTGQLNIRWNGQAATAAFRTDGFVSLYAGLTFSQSYNTPAVVPDLGGAPFVFRGQNVGGTLNNPNTINMGTPYGFAVVPTSADELAEGVERGKPVLSVSARTGITYVLKDVIVAGKSVIKTGDYGIGSSTPVIYSDANTLGVNQLIRMAPGTPNMPTPTTAAWAGITWGYDGGSRCQLLSQQGQNLNNLVFRVSAPGAVWSSYATLWHSTNTTVDANGFLKKASPIVKLFGDGTSELTDESQGVTTERIDTGVYRVYGVLGFNSDGAWGGAGNGIEIPVDDNKRPLIWIESKVLPDGDIEVRTYHRTYDTGPYSTRNIEVIDSGEVYKKKPIFVPMPDGTPIDIPAGRWIDLRVEMPVSDEPEPIVEPEPQAIPDPVPEEEKPQEFGEETAPNETATQTEN